MYLVPGPDRPYRAFQTFGAFTSGIGIHYSPSTIVNTTHQAHASKLVVGQRMLPHVFVRAADARPFEIQDLLPADTRFKVLVFAGNTTDAQQLARVRDLASAIDDPEGFYRKFGGSDPSKVFDVMSICKATKSEVNYTDLPPVFRTHWSKYVSASLSISMLCRLTCSVVYRVLLDDADMFQRTGGDGYEKYGIDEAAGAVVVVRPDGYVGIVAPYDSINDIRDYFGAFMKA